MATPHEDDDWRPDIPALQAHDDAEWRRVEQSYCGRLLAYAQRRVSDLQGAEDVVQEALLGAVRGIGDFDTKYTFEQYLFGICRNRTIDHLRRRKARTGTNPSTGAKINIAASTVAFFKVGSTLKERVSD